MYIVYLNTRFQNMWQDTFLCVNVHLYLLTLSRLVSKHLSVGTLRAGSSGRDEHFLCLAFSCQYR